jgi:lycopene cyclase domain-containing protein
VSLYLALDFLVAAFPLALSFDRRVRYARRWPAAALSAVIVCVPFAAWDSLMSARGAWGFNPAYAGSVRVAFLPPAELLFFLVVPFACLFLYEVASEYWGGGAPRARRAPWFAAAAACAALAAAAWPRLYTSSVLAAAALFLLLAALAAPALLAGRAFWLGLLLSFAPFLLANGVLTALPVVTYAPWAILGPRAYTIPLEDFLYSFTLLGFCILVYRSLRDRLSIRPPDIGLPVRTARPSRGGGPPAASRMSRRASPFASGGRGDVPPLPPDPSHEVGEDERAEEDKGEKREVGGVRERGEEPEVADPPEHPEQLDRVQEVEHGALKSGQGVPGEAPSSAEGGSG